MDFLLLALGAGLLYAGGVALVQGAASLARSLGLSSLVIGLTVVAFGTSAPELASSLVAAFRNADDVALGNILGSNIANVGLILGLSILLKPLVAKAQVLKRELPFMIATGLILIPLAWWNGVFGRGDGIFLLLLFAAYLWVLFRDDDEDLAEEVPEADYSRGVSAALVAAGVGLLVFGADLLVDGAVGIARTMGLSEQVIGLSLVALGTSLPELAASVVAATHDEGDMALGNIIGSNVFNVLLVLGATVTVHPIPVSMDAFGRDLLVALAFSFVPLLLLLRSRQLHRFEGAILLGGYAVYMFFLFR